MLPKVTTSKEEFIKHIIATCESENIDEEKQKNWVKKVKNNVSAGNYFWGMIYVEEAHFNLIAHELIHHLIEHLRIRTQNEKWVLLHDLNDSLYILLFLWR